MRLPWEGNLRGAEDCDGPEREMLCLWQTIKGHSSLHQHELMLRNPWHVLGSTWQETGKNSFVLS